MIVQKEQVNALIEQGQKRGLTGKEVIDALVRKGYEPEGVDVNAIKQSFIKPTPQTVTPTTHETSMVDKIKQGFKDSTVFGTNDTSLEDIQKKSEDFAMGFAGGASGVIKNTLVNAGKKTISDLVASADDLAKLPSQIADSLSEKITVLDPKVKNILNTTSLEKFDNYVKVGEEAIKNSRALTPLEQAGDVVKNKVLPIIRDDLKNIGSQKSKSLSSVGTTQVKNATLDVIDYIKNTTKELKLTADEKKLIKQAISDLEVGANPTLATLDKTVDLLQSTLFEKSKGLAIPATSRVKSIINQSINKLNTTVKNSAKDALGSDEYAVLNEAYSIKKNLFNTVNKLLGEEGKKGGSLIKRFFSPQDSGIKKTFAKIKELYGIDLAEDATLAKFIMESLGDTRAASLLETVPLTKSGLATKAINYGYNKLQKPIKKARQTIVELQAQ